MSETTNKVRRVASHTRNRSDIPHKRRLKEKRKSRKKSLPGDLSINLPISIKVAPSPFLKYKGPPQNKRMTKVIDLAIFQKGKNDTIEELSTISIDNNPTPKISTTFIKVSNQSSKIIKEGWLWKLGKSFLQKWKRKYCVLTSESLVYYDSQDTLRIKGCLKFSFLYCEILIPSMTIPEYLKIIVKGSKKEFIFKGDNTESTKCWANTIHKVYSNHQTTVGIAKIRLTLRDPTFWKVALFFINSMIEY